MARNTTAKRLEITRDIEIADRYDPLLRAELQEFYESLNEVDKKVFILRTEGYTIEEIANYLGVSKSRVRQRLVRIKHRLVDYVEMP